MVKSILFKLAVRGGRAVAGVFRGLGDDLAGLERRTAAAGQGGVAAARGADTARQAWQRQASQARATGEAMRQAGEELRRTTSQQKRLAAQTQRTNAVLAARDKAAEGRNTRKDSMSELPGVAAPLLAIAAPVKMAIDMESAMADVRKVVDFKSPDGLEQLQKQLMLLSTTKIPLKAKELAAIAAAGGQLGIAEDKLAPFVTTTAKMALAWDMTAEEAGDASAKLANVFGIPINEVERLGDAINHLSDNSAAKASEMVRSLTRVGGVSKMFGLSAVQTSALTGAFIALGKPPEVAATAINGMLPKLMAADKQGKKFSAALNELGMDARSLKDAIAQDAQGALIQFLEAVAASDESSRMGLLTDLFGLEYADDLASLVGSLDGYKKAVAQVATETNYAGSMTREFENRTKTTANQLNMLVNKVSGLAINFGTALLPAINSGANALGVVADGLAALVEEFPNATSVMAQFTGGLLALAVAWKGAKFASKFLGGSFKEMWYGGKAVGHRVGALGRRFGLGGKGKDGGKAGAMGQVAESLAGGGATPVFVTNWPGGLGGGGLGGGGSDLGGLLDGGGKGAGKGAGAAATRQGGKGVAGLARRGLDWAKGLGGRGLGWLGGIGGKLTGKAGLAGLKGLGKAGLKKIPGVGVLVGAALGLERALAGDLLGAVGETASGLAALVPGLGTAASLAIDAGLAARDFANEEEAAGPEDLALPASPAAPDLDGVGRELAGLAPGASGPITITINQPITAPGADARSLETILGQSRQDLKRLIEQTVTELFARQQRTSLGNVG